MRGETVPDGQTIFGPTDVRGETGPDGQNIFGHADVLINDKYFCERQYLCVLRQQIKITLTFIENTQLSFNMGPVSP